MSGQNSIRTQRKCWIHVKFIYLQYSFFNPSIVYSFNLDDHLNKIRTDTNTKEGRNCSFCSLVVSEAGDMVLYEVIKCQIRQAIHYLYCTKVRTTNPKI